MFSWFTKPCSINSAPEHLEAKCFIVDVCIKIGRYSDSANIQKLFNFPNLCKIHLALLSSWYGKYQIAYSYIHHVSCSFFPIPQQT